MEGRINDAEDCVRKALDLIPLLISNAFYTKVFTGRWQAIASKLQLLNQTITAILKEPSCCYWSENSLLKELLSKVVSTLQVARELVKCCRVLSCSWKLMKQSDLDVLVDKLSFHQRDLQVLIKSGLLRESNDASVVSRPGLGARRDAVVLFLRGLFAKIQIGNTQLKEQALFVLVQILLEDGNNIDVVADEKLDIGFLVHLLYSHIVTLREYSVVAVSILVHSFPCKACLVREGVIAPLIGILESGSCVAKEKAAEALLELTVNSDKASVNVGMNVTLGICRCNYGEDIDRENACAITADCGLSALVDNCKCGSPEGQAIASAVLRNLAFVEEIRGPMAEEGAIPVLINLVNCGTTLAQESSAQCLYLLASNHEKLRQKICMEGGVESLVLLLERAPSPEAQEIILKTIHSLSASTCSISLLMSSGFVNDLTVLLGSERVEIQELAAMIICNLSRTEETKRALGGAGCIGLLANMLDGEPSFSHAIAARALSSLLAVDCNRKEFVKNDENVYCLVQLLDPKNDTVSNVFLISALLALSHSSSGRKKMACAGAYQHLEKLAEMEVGGAKKVLHKMTTKYKLRKMLSSKW